MWDATYVPAFFCNSVPRDAPIGYKCIQKTYRIECLPLQENVSGCCFQGRGEAAAVFSYVSGRMIKDACDLALSVGDFHLALLISQSISSEDTKQIMKQQLSTWYELEVSGLSHAVTRFRSQQRSHISSGMTWCFDVESRCAPLLVTGTLKPIF